MVVAIVIDTNLLISALIGRKTRIHLERIIEEYVTGTIQIYYCNTLVSEFWEVASRPKFRKYFSLQQALAFVRSFLRISEEVEVTSSVDASRDPKDNFLLALCSTVQADYLVSGDKGLLAMKTYESTQIITLSDFASLLPSH